MYFDNVAIYMEQTQPPGSYGDSCAETSRYFDLLRVRESKGLSNEHLPRHTEKEAKESLTYFRTDSGYVRHHNVPEDWKEKDFSSDQAMPWYLATEKWDMQAQANEMRSRIVSNDYRTGNNNVIALPFAAVIYRKNGSFDLYLTDLVILGQALLLKYFPYRWNEAKANKGEYPIESTKDSTADWLNFLHAIFNQEYYGHTFISTFTKSLFTKEELYSKLEAYYKPEPNAEWVLEAYKEVIDRMFK